MKNRHKAVLYWTIAAIVVVGLIGGLVVFSNQPGQFDELAKCLEEKGVTFFGAYWCPACNQQKALFGRSQQYLPYTECSEPGTRTQNNTCIEAGIQAYPTWEFANGERVEGIISPEELARLTSCSLPQ